MAFLSGNAAITLMLWRMYQTLTSPQRQQFSQMLQVVRTRQ